MDLVVGTICGIAIGVAVTLLSREWVISKLPAIKAKLQAWKSKLP